MKAIQNRLSKLPNKPKTTKAQFITAAKAKVAPKIKAKIDHMNELTIQLINYYKTNKHLDEVAARDFMKTYRPLLRLKQKEHYLFHDYYELFLKILKENGYNPVPYPDLVVRYCIT